MDYRIANPSGDYIIYLLNNNNVIQQHTITSSRKIEYLHLKPGDYKIKVLIDVNHNGKWDPGDYKLKKQPETILFFEKTITVRGYWEVEEMFNIR